MNLTELQLSDIRAGLLKHRFSEDIVQETLLRLLECPHPIQHLMAYADTVARRLVISQWRQARRLVSLDDLMALSDRRQNPERQAMHRQRLQRYFDGMTRTWGTQHKRDGLLRDGWRPDYRVMLKGG